MNIDFNNYDKIHLGVSGGKDSTASLLWLIYKSEIPHNKIVVSFCDTGNEDALTYAYLKMLNDKVFPITTIKPPLDFWELAKKKKRFPSARARFCTQHLKIIPSMRFISSLIEGGNNILLLSGVRKDEGHSSNDRGNREIFSLDDTFGCYKYLPIYEWSLSDVWECHKRHLPLDWVINIVNNDPDLSKPHKEEIKNKIKLSGIPFNPLYAMQAKRVGCFPCINSRKLEVRAMAKYRPDLVDFIAMKEIEVGEARNNNDISTFFSPNMTTKRFRSKATNAKDGRVVYVPTIRDVVKWAKTARGGKQYQMEFAAFDEFPVACDYSGMCE